jgi:tetratricopeptide (TPR) repeat protein
MIDTSNKFDLKKSAKELRQAKKDPEALEIYRSLWNLSKDVFNGAGLLHCLRKMDLYEEAIKIAEELEPQCNSLDWCRNEVIWVYTSGILRKLNDEANLSQVLPIASKIMALRPDGLAAKLVVFKVLKIAKKENNWNIINEWVMKLDPTSLSVDPIKDEKDRDGWCDQSCWYNFRIQGLIEMNQHDQAITLVDEIANKYSREKKYFLRLKAVALHKSNKNDESEKIYEDLCRHPKADWWLLQEYASVLQDIDKCDLSLLIYCRAAQTANKPEMMVKMVADIGFLYKKLSRNKESYLHFLAAKFIREDNGWKIPHELESAISELSVEFTVDQFPADSKSALRQCREIWQKETGKINDQSAKPKRQLNGIVLLGNPEKPFCFIQVANAESVFCYKNNLPPGILDKMMVIFDAIPSFDKKKNRETYRAMNIKPLSSSPHP